jgi:hypothetical protein
MTWAHYLFFHILLCTLDLHAGTIANNTAMPMFANQVQGQSSAMAPPFIQGGQANATMSLSASDMYGSSSNISAPFFQGGLTGLLLGVEQDATLSKSARKLHFNE